VLGKSPRVVPIGSWKKPFKKKGLSLRFKVGRDWRGLLRLRHFCFMGVLPAVVERETGEDEEEANGGAPWADEPEIDGESESSEDEDSGNPRVAPASVGAREIRLEFAKTKEGDDSEAIENPSGEDEEVGEFFEGAGEGHDAGENALKDQGAARSAVLGVDAVGDPEEGVIAGHGVRDAGAAEDRGVHRAESGDDHGKSDPSGETVAEDAIDDVGSDVSRVGDGTERKHFQARGAEEEIDEGDERDSTDQSAGKIAVRVFDFGADEVEVFPAIVGPESGGECGEKSGEQTGFGSSGPNGIGWMRRRTGKKKCNADDEGDADDFDGGEKNLHAAAEAHAEIVNAGDDDEPEDREGLRPGELKIVGRNPVRKAGNRDVDGEKRRGDCG